MLTWQGCAIGVPAQGQKYCGKMAGCQASQPTVPRTHQALLPPCPSREAYNAEQARKPAQAAKAAAKKQKKKPAAAELAPAESAQADPEAVAAGDAG